MDLWKATDAEKLTLKAGDKVTAGGSEGIFRGLTTMRIRGQVRVATVHVDWVAK